MAMPPTHRRSPLAHGPRTPRDGRDRRRAVALFLAAGALLPGCSFFFVQPPPPEPMWERLPDASCTTSRFWPAIDAVAALAQLGQGVLVSPTGQAGRTSLTNDEKIATGVGVALWGISSVVGFARTGRCEDYQRFVRAQTWRPPPMVTPQPAGMPPGWEPPEQRPLPVAPPNQPSDPGDAPPADEAYPGPGGTSPGQDRAPQGDPTPTPDAAPDAPPPAPEDGPPPAAPSDPQAAPEAG